MRSIEVVFKQNYNKQNIFSKGNYLYCQVLPSRIQCKTANKHENASRYYAETRTSSHLLISSYVIYTVTVSKQHNFFHFVPLTFSRLINLCLDFIRP